MTDDVLHNSLTFLAERPTRDTPEAVLAAALKKLGLQWPGGTAAGPSAAHDLRAALPPDWCGHEADSANWPSGWRETVAEYEATIARLRKIEEAARAWSDAHTAFREAAKLHRVWDEPDEVIYSSPKAAALRAALAEGDER